MNKDNKRKDAKKRKAKVIKTLLKNPTQTITELAKDTWLSIWNVHNKLKEVEKQGIKDTRILWICDTDLDIVKLWQKIIMDKLNDKKVVSKMRAVEVSQVIAENTKRYTIFKWDITDAEWWLRSDKISDEDVLIYIN